MLKDVAFPAVREKLPEMLDLLSNEVDPHILQDKWRNRLRVCFEEILVNICDYSGSDKLYISCELINNNTFRFEFSDDGMPYNPLEEAPEVDVDAGIDERRIGGLGIFLYTTIMTKMEYNYSNGRNHLIALKEFSCEEVD